MPVDDGVDKLNRKYTLLVFLFLALPIFTKQYIGDPIECFAPVYFAEHQSRYINSYCWTQSTYYMVPVGDPEDDADQVSSEALLVTAGQAARLSRRPQICSCSLMLVRGPRPALGSSRARSSGSGAGAADRRMMDRPSTAGLAAGAICAARFACSRPD